MSRLIDETKPLSDDDRAFLLQNGQENRVRQLDATHGVETPLPPFMTGGEPALQTGVPMGVLSAPGLSPAQIASVAGGAPQFLALASASEEQLKEELRRRKAVRQAAGVAEQTEPDVASELVVETDESQYETWSADELRAQLEYRELSKAGNKTEMAARLREDDEERDAE